MPHDEDTPLHSHLEICIGPTGVINFYPKGDPEKIATAIRFMIRLFTDNPETVDCAAGIHQPRPS